MQSTDVREHKCGGDVFVHTHDSQNHRVCYHGHTNLPSFLANIASLKTGGWCSSFTSFLQFQFEFFYVLFYCKLFTHCGLGNIYLVYFLFSFCFVFLVQTVESLRGRKVSKEPNTRQRLSSLQVLSNGQVFTSLGHKFLI